MAIRYVMMAIRDRAADCFSTPMFFTSVGGGVRSFTDEINRPAENNQYYNHPEDFDLYELGSYTDETADFEILPQPRQVAIGKDVSRRER